MSLRTRKDAELIRTKACPAAGANHNSDTIDLGAAGDAVLEQIELEIAIPALPANVDPAHSVTAKLQDSADDTTYADLVGVASVAVPGVATTGSAAVTRVVRLPSHTRRYLQANIAATAGAGNNTGRSVTLSPLF